MKFGKRFLYFQGEDKEGYLNYKALKQALKRDCEAQSHLGVNFDNTLRKELEKVDRHYFKREDALQSELEALSASGNKQERVISLSETRKNIQQLTNFAALNYSAVLKAVKKRNRRLPIACGDSIVPASPSEFFQEQAFFSSTKLGEIIENAQSLTEEFHGSASISYSRLMQEFRCPICLERLSSPARLPCDHAFCWSCITMYCLRALQTTESGSSTWTSKNSASSDRIVIPGKSQFNHGWKPQAGKNASDTKRYLCPVCQKQHMLDLDGLTVDKYLNDWVDPASSISSESTHTTAEAPASAVSGNLSDHEGSTAADSVDSGSISSSEEKDKLLIGEQEPKWHGKLVIVLDLDGTLIASFPPRRAPYLPDHMVTHLVGRGSGLNPQGVFVVERPGLAEFLKQTSELGELVVFTAGLPEYAKPILQAIDPTGEYFGDRIIYRAGTSQSPEYPCVKDLSRLGRPLSRTLIVDDTPLAFLWQPQNGVPVLGFRGAQDDNLLMDAVLPLLRNADQAGDVRPFLDKRFGMEAWFHGHKYQTRPPRSRVRKSAPARGTEPATASAAARKYVMDEVQRSWTPSMPKGGPMVLCNFDNTILDFDVAERITERLAPELLPMLVAPTDTKQASTVSKMPVVNSVLEEMRQRGVKMKDLEAALVDLGSEIPDCMKVALQQAREYNMVLRMMSNSNDYFVTHVLAGAKMKDTFHDIVTNITVIRRAESEARDVMSTNSALSAAREVDSDKLVITPCQPVNKPHSCPFCAPEFCKGLYVKAMLDCHSRIVLCGDGANDLCSVLCLRDTDVALIRAQYTCYLLLKERERQGKSVAQPVCQIEYWSTQTELAQLLQQATS